MGRWPRNSWTYIFHGSLHNQLLLCSLSIFSCAGGARGNYKLEGNLSLDAPFFSMTELGYPIATFGGYLLQQLLITALLFFSHAFVFDLEIQLTHVHSYMTAGWRNPGKKLMSPQAVPCGAQNSTGLFENLSTWMIRKKDPDSTIVKIVSLGGLERIICHE